MISSAALQQKLDAWAKSPEGQKRIKDTIERYDKQGRKFTNAGSPIDGRAGLIEAADKMISCLRAAAVDAGLPESVRAHFDSLNYTNPVEVGDGRYMVSVYFSDDLHRDSLENDLGYEGIDNVIALFNNGAHAENFVYGWWNNHSPSGEAISRSMPGDSFAWVRSKKDREGLHFIQQAVSDFNGNYGSIYNVTATAGSDYK